MGCSERGCPYPAGSTGVCRYHATAFEFGMSMTDRAFDVRDIFNDKQPGNTDLVVVGARELVSDPERFRFEYTATPIRPSVPKPRLRECAGCHRIFMPRRFGTTTCSQKCAEDAWYERHYQRPCPRHHIQRVCANPKCGKLFTPRRAGALVCSRTCSGAWGFKHRDRSVTQ